MNLLEGFREFEMERVKPHLANAKRILEIGGGSGHQARLIESWGATVASLDIPDRPRHEPQQHPIIDYDGVNIPARDGAFDAVFSSNCLEHVTDLEALLRDTRRVLKNGGICVHVMPTVTWRLWTSLAHYVFVAKRLAGVGHEVAGVAPISAAGVVRKRGIAGAILRVLAAGPHGASRNALQELFTFSRFRWRREFRRHGFRVVAEERGGLFYTGYVLFSRWRLEGRQHASRLLGSATRTYVVTPEPGI